MKVKLCSVGSCDCKIHAKGFCRMHYQRFLRYGTTKPKEKLTLYAKLLANYEVDENGCWLFLGANTTGYPSIGGNGRTWLGHRISYEENCGPIPKGLLVLHKCDVRRCFNPNHLFLGTHQDNTDDMIRKGRGNGGIREKEKTHCKHGHPFSGSNLRVNKNGSRTCITCACLRSADFRHKKRKLSGHKK